MSTQNCEWLDDYLSRDLDSSKEQAFREHLPECHVCRALVEQHERLVATLSEAARVLCPAPDGLVARTGLRLKRARRRRAVAWTLSAAAAALVLWAMALSLPRKTLPVEPPSAPVEAVVASTAEPAAGVQVSFPNASKLLIVPEKTESPDVTFVWVYPNQRSAQ